MPTAFQIAQVRQTPFTGGLFKALLDQAPLFSAFDARPTAGTKFYSLALISLPTAGFVNLGEGMSASEGGFELREFSCSLIGGMVKAEKISAGLWDGSNGAPGSWFDLQTQLRMKADVLHVERQMILGTTNDAKGFPGAKDLTPFSAGVFTLTETAAKYSFQRGVLNVAGTTANTASSVYSFVFGEQESQLVLGNDSGGELVTLGEIRRQSLAPDPVNAPTRLLEFDVAQMEGFVGLSVAGFNQQLANQTIPVQYAVRRACNITSDAGKTCTDQVMSKLSLSHGTGRRPSIFAMSHRSGEQLAAARQAVMNYNMGSGDAVRSAYVTYPDPPDNWRGIPIIYPNPDVIGDSDAIEA